VEREVAVPMTLGSYLPYAPSETREVLFDAYVAYLGKAAP